MAAAAFLWRPTLRRAGCKEDLGLQPGGPRAAAWGPWGRSLHHLALQPTLEPTRATWALQARGLDVAGIGLVVCYELSGGQACSHMPHAL